MTCVTPSAFSLAQRVAERGVVGLPRAAPGDAAQAEPVGLRREDLRTQSVRSAARRLLVEHRDHADEVVLARGRGAGRRNCPCRRSRKWRREAGQWTGSAPSAFSAPKNTNPRWPGFLTRGVNPLRASSQASRLSGGARGPWRQRHRLQWRDRVGFAPTSRGRRGRASNCQSDRPAISQTAGRSIAGLPRCRCFS